MGRGDFQKNFLKLFKGTVLGQTIPILVSPIVSRLYSPSDIGAFALYSSVAAIAINIVCLKFDQAIVLPSNNQEATRIFNIALKTSKYIAVIAVIVVIFCKILSFFGIVAKFSNWWLLIGVHIYYLGIYQSSMFLLNRGKRYIEISRSKIYNGVIYSFLQILLFKLNELGLVLSLFFSRLLVAEYLAKTVRKNKISRGSKITLFFSKLDKALIVKYRHFPMFSASNSFLNSSSNHMPVLILGAFYTSSVAGIYSWANRIIQTPMGFITSSIQQVFYQETAQRVSNGQGIYKFVLLTYKKMFLVGFVPYLVMFFFAPEIFSFFFGSAWVKAGHYTRYLIPWLFLVFLNSPITSIVPVLGQQKKYFVNEIVLLLLRGGALILGYVFFKNADISVLFFGTIGALYNAYLFFYLINVCKRWERSIVS